jgi:hypothetical protein
MASAVFLYFFLFIVGAYQSPFGTNMMTIADGDAAGRGFHTVGLDHGRPPPS